MIAGAAVRVPGIAWLVDAAPHAQLSLHPDEQRFISWADEFEEKPDFPYVQGMTTHIYVVGKFAQLVFDHSLNLLIVARLVSVVYGMLLIGLIAVVVRALTSSAELGLLSAAFLAFAPAHIISSHFGTVDSAVTFYFILAAFLGWCHARIRAEVTLVSLAAAVGVGLGIKFILPILAPLMLVFVFEKEKIRRGLLASLTFAVAFFAVNFFSLTPWDIVRSIRMNIYDALIAKQACGALVSSVVDGCGPIPNGVYYFHGVFSMLGVLTGFFAVLGALVGAVGLWRYGRNNRLQARDPRRAIRGLARHPLTVFSSPFLLTLLLLMTMDLRAVRFALPLVPMLCLAAAVGLSFLLARAGSWLTKSIALCAVFGYAALNAAGVQYVFHNDIRNQVAEWIENEVEEDAAITAFLPYSIVKGVTPIVGDDYNISRVYSSYFVTCNLEYERYFSSTSADEIFHAHGGQARVDFYHELFGNERGYTPIKTFHRATFTPEQDLIASGILVPLDTFTPERCVVFQRTAESPPGGDDPSRGPPRGS